MVTPAEATQTNEVFFSDVVDLGHELFDGMANLGASIASFWPSETHAGTARTSGGKLAFESHMILISEHTGTHLDCPFHFDPNGITVDQYPLKKLMLPGHLLDFTSKGPHEAITPADFEAAAQRTGKPVGSGTAVIAWTGQDKNWGKPGFKTERPYLPAESATWLIEHGATLFGTDLIGIDNPDEWWEPTHVAFLRGGLPMVQQLANLDQLAGKRFLFVALPLKMRGGTGSPIRPVALII
jgi:kynurenine formamidase